MAFSESDENKRIRFPAYWRLSMQTRTWNCSSELVFSRFSLLHDYILDSIKFKPCSDDEIIMTISDSNRVEKYLWKREKMVTSIFTFYQNMFKTLLPSQLLKNE